MSELRGIEAVMSVEAPTAAALPAPADLALPVDGEQRLAAPPTGAARLRARRRFALACLGVDAATLIGAVVASSVANGPDGLHWSLSPWALLFPVLTIAFFQNRGLYQRRLGLPVLDDVRRVGSAMALAAAVVIALHAVAVPGSGTSAIVRPFLFAAVYVTAGRLALYWSESKSRAAGEAVRRTLVVGAGRVGRVLARRLLAQRSLGLEPIGFLDGNPLVVGHDDVLELPLLGQEEELEEIVERYRVDHLVVTFSNERDDAILALVNRAEALGVTVSIVPRLYEKLPGRVTVEHLGGLPLLTPHATDPRGLSVALKYGLDRLVAGLLLLLAAPVLGLCAAAVYLSMGRPIFFRQIRIGRDGEEFGILKFRSMKLPTAEELEAQARAIAEGLPGGVEGVDRRTRVGTFLRKTSLDELPQLLNVLRGDMSIVGPRPERPEFVSKFEHTIYRYTDRHRVKSGITGWAQVHGLRGKTSIEDRAEWDNWYVENLSLWLDVKILVRTVGAVLKAFADVE